MITVTTKLQVSRERAGRKRLSEKPRAKDGVPVACVPHISRLMAWRSNSRECCATALCATRRNWPG